MKQGAQSFFETVKMFEAGFENVVGIFTEKEKSVINILLINDTAMSPTQILNHYIDRLLVIATYIIDNKDMQELHDKEAVRLTRYPFELIHTHKTFVKEVRNYRAEGKKSKLQYRKLASILSNTANFDVPSQNTIKGILEHLASLGILLKRVSSETKNREYTYWAVSPKFKQMMKDNRMKLLK